MSFLILGLLLIYGGIVAALYLMQSKLIFQPALVPAYPPSAELIGAQTVKLQTADGLELLSWWLAPAENMPVILYFHGNAGSVVDRAFRYKLFHERGFGILGLSYRGYGGNPGVPTEQGLYTDARAAIAFVRGQGIPDERMVLYGESLGTGVAIQMATEMQPGMLVLEAPYTSVADRGQELYPFIPVKLLIQHRFDSLSKITGVTAPVLLFHGEKDLVIPVKQGRRLFEVANEPKKGVFFKDNGHTDFDVHQIAILIEEFAREHGVMHGEAL